MLNAEEIKKDFPALNRKVRTKQLVYLDNAATSQKPQQVIDAVVHYYKTSNANVHRGFHKLAEEATLAYQEAKQAVAQFINARSWKEIIFTKNTTESLNLLSYSLANELNELKWNEGDEIIISRSEHHSNFVPWQQSAKRGKFLLKIVDIKKDGTIDIDQLCSLLSKKTRLVSIVHISNVLGSINDVKRIAAVVHENNCIYGKTLFCVDGAQSVPHLPVDVQDIDCDFLAFSGHKMLAPTGIGVLYGKKELLEKMPPFLYGGGMIHNVNLMESTWTELPWKFEAGTQNIAGAVGLSTAIKYLQKIGMKNVWGHDNEIAEYAIQQLRKKKNIILYGSGFEKGLRSSVISFNLANIHSHDVSSILDMEGVAVRAGHHCAQPLLDFMNTPATVRLSGYIYTTKNDIDALITALEKAEKVFG